MLSINKVMLAGRLTHDPKVRVLKTGTSVADIGLAVNERIKTKEGTWDQKTLFVDAVCWGKQAETIGKYMKKGSGILVEGALQMDTWTSKEGENRSKLRVLCQQFQFTDQNSNKKAEKRVG